MDSTFASFLPLLILVVIIVLYVIGYKKFKRNNGVEHSGPNGETPYGVFGVLGFFIFASYYIAPLFVLGQTANSLQKAELAYPVLLTMPGYNTYKICTYLMVIGLIVWQIQVAKGLRKNFTPSSLKNAKILCFTSPWLVAIADMVFASITMSFSANAQSIGSYVAGIITSGLWGLYFLFSKRCKNTYLSGQAASTP